MELDYGVSPVPCIVCFANSARRGVLILPLIIATFIPRVVHLDEQNSFF